MKNYRKNQLKTALKLQKEYNSKDTLEDLLETHSWVLMQEGKNPYAGIRAAKKTIGEHETKERPIYE